MRRRGARAAAVEAGRAALDLAPAAAAAVLGYAGRHAVSLAPRSVRRTHGGSVPAAAYALVATFVALSVAIGSLMAWVVGPRRLVAIVLPTLAAFAAFYLVGHRLGWAIGPDIELYGFQVAILSDVLVAGIAAGSVAGLQRVVAGRSPRRARA
jgi:hypothetical protein